MHLNLYVFVWIMIYACAHASKNTSYRTQAFKFKIRYWVNEERKNDTNELLGAMTYRWRAFQNGLSSDFSMKRHCPCQCLDWTRTITCTCMFMYLCICLFIWMCTVVTCMYGLCSSEYIRFDRDGVTLLWLHTHARACTHTYLVFKLCSRNHI